jgi:hypothetical protein
MAREPRRDLAGRSTIEMGQTCDVDERPLWVDSGGSIAVPRTAGIGADASYDRNSHRVGSPPPISAVRHSRREGQRGIPGFSLSR